MIKRILDHRAAGVNASSLMAGLLDRVVGQDPVIQKIVGVYRRFTAGMGDPTRPAGSILMLGPTGTGKTRTVEAMAEHLYGNARAVIKVDCGEFQRDHEIAKLIGSPPGYTGHRETQPMLNQEVLNQHFTDSVKMALVLFDELDKASDALWNLLLGILDKATLTLGDNRRVDFSQAMVFCTCNTGSREIADSLVPSMGFSVQPSLDSARLRQKIAKIGTAAARRRFTPEFLGRFDEILSFVPLGEKEVARILDIELEHVARRFASISGGAVVQICKAAKQVLLKEGTADPRSGARAIKRVIERRVADSLGNLIASGSCGANSKIGIDVSPAGDDLVFYALERSAVAAAARA